MQRPVQPAVRSLFSRISLVELCGVVVIFVAVLGAIFWAAHGDRDATLDRMSVRNLHSIRIALQTYQQQNGTLPPAYVCDSSGVPIHSWRVLILPQLGYFDLYRRYDFSEPWNSSHNLIVAAEMPVEYRCQFDPRDTDNHTHYLAVVGAGTVWPGARAARVAADDQRIMVLQVAGSNIVWSEPSDLPLASITPERQSAPGLLVERRRGLPLATLNRLVILPPEMIDDSSTRQLREMLTHGTGIQQVKGN
jgi:hypothetical protein